MTARPGALLLAGVLWWLSPEVVDGSDCDGAPKVSSPPPAIAPPPDPAYETARHIDGYADAYLGIGYLAVQEPEHDFDWYRQVALPLFRAPGGEHLGWLHHGWVELDGRREPFVLAGSTETGYEHASLIALDETDDGWIRIRVAPDGDERAGTAWTHRCTLSIGGASLSLRRWGEHFSSPDHAPLYFRKNVPHALRTGPGVEHPRITWIGRDDEVEPLELRGDWMRVKIFQPGKFHAGCNGASEWSGRVREGWIRWWDRRSGPWLYWFTRGC